eukprot:381290_1
MVQQHPVPSVFIKVSELSMAALQLMILIVITKIISSTNDSSFELPQEIQERIYSYFTAEQHYSIRRLNKGSHNLFVKLHATKSDEMNSWVQFKTFLSQFLITTHLQHYTTFAQSLRRTFLAQLQAYTAFAQSLRRLNYTTHQLVMIEKLFCIIMNNPKITSSNFQIALATALHYAMYGYAPGPSWFDDVPFRMDSYQRYICDGSGMRCMMNIFHIRRLNMLRFTDVCVRDLVYHHALLKSPSITRALYSCHHARLRIMWTLAISEKNITGNVENRYTLFALGYMKWILQTSYGIAEHYPWYYYQDRMPRNLLQEAVDDLWNTVITITDLEFIHYFLSFEQLLMYSIPTDIKSNLIALILDDVLAEDGTFEPKHLELFCLGRSALWNLQYVIEYAVTSRFMGDSCSGSVADGYCWSSMKKLLHWIFEHKLSVATCNPIDVMYLFIRNGILTMDDVLCEIETNETQLVHIVSFDLLKRIIDCRETAQHKTRLHRWLVSDHNTERNRTIHNWTVMDGGDHVEMDLKQPRAMFSSTHQKGLKERNKKSYKTANGPLCCGVM